MRSPSKHVKLFSCVRFGLINNLPSKTHPVEQIRCQTSVNSTVSVNLNRSGLMIWKPGVQLSVMTKSSANEPLVHTLCSFISDSVVWCVCVCVGVEKNRGSTRLIIKYQSSAVGPIKTALGKHQLNQSHETKFTALHTCSCIHTRTHSHTHSHTDNR